MSKSLCKILFVCSLALFGISVFAQLYTSNKFVIKGATLTDFQARKNLLEKEVALLEMESLSLGSLAYVEDQARKTGFVDLEYISVITPVSFAVATDN